MGYPQRGERTWARIVTHLIVMGTTTSLPFAWFDEPLEHLDPQLRHAVAATLATATRGDSPRQLLVITYEHDIAQQLADVLTAGRTTISVDYCAGPVRPQERPGRTGSNARVRKLRNSQRDLTRPRQMLKFAATVVVQIQPIRFPKALLLQTLSQHCPVPLASIARSITAGRNRSSFRPAF